jgi:mono/diheme cytochrome c family protein
MVSGRICPTNVSVFETSDERPVTDAELLPSCSMATPNRAGLMHTSLISRASVGISAFCGGLIMETSTSRLRETRVGRALCMFALLAGVCAVSVRAQAPIPREPTLPKTTVGSELYRFYCANCHGQDAKGRAPTPAMRTASADLTTLAKRNDGVFPRESIRALLIHGPEKGSAHGTSDMPAWGTIFRAFDKNDTVVALRVDNLVAYLESIQVAAAARSVQ